MFKKFTTMTQITNLLEQYRRLNKRSKKQFLDLIDKEEKHPVIASIERGLEEIRLIQEGKLKAKTWEQFLLENSNGH